jgi:hypothetical protein
MKSIIIDHKTNNDARRYIDRFGQNYGFDSIEAATPFESAMDAQAWLDAWDAGVEDGTRKGYMSDQWAEIVPFAQANPELRIITAYRVDGYYDEVTFVTRYIGDNKAAADNVYADDSEFRSMTHTTFEFPLWETESMPDGHKQWMDRWFQGQIVE